MSACAHIQSMSLDHGLLGAAPLSTGCGDCLAAGSQWVHLRRCLDCGAVGCCDSSPNRHASRHAREHGHPLVQSFEPGEDWVWCFADEVALAIRGAENSPSHP